MLRVFILRARAFFIVFFEKKSAKQKKSAQNVNSRKSVLSFFGVEFFFYCFDCFFSKMMILIFYELRNRFSTYEFSFNSCSRPFSGCFIICSWRKSLRLNFSIYKFIFKSLKKKFFFKDLKIKKI